MKHIFKIFFACLLSAALCCGFAAAAETGVAVTSPNAQIYVQGVPALFPNEKGDYMPAISYQGSTYMPLRSAGEWMGKNVSWEEQTQTVTLDGTAAVTIHGENESANGSVHRGVSEGTAKLCPDRKVILNGNPVTFHNEKGAAIYPISFLNVTYLPLRSIGELTGMEVKWVAGKNGSRGLIYLRKPISSSELQELEAYVDQIHAAAKEWYQLSTGFDQSTQTAQTVGGIRQRTLTNTEKAQELLPAMRQQANDFLALCHSEASLMQYYQGELQKELQSYLTDIDRVGDALAKGETLIAGSENGEQSQALSNLSSNGATLRLAAHIREIVEQSGFVDAFA